MICIDDVVRDHDRWLDPAKTPMLDASEPIARAYDRIRSLDAEELLVAREGRVVGTIRRADLQVMVSAERLSRYLE